MNLITVKSQGAGQLSKLLFLATELSRCFSLYILIYCKLVTAFEFFPNLREVPVFCSY